MDRQDFMGLYESYMDVYEDEEYLEDEVEGIDEGIRQILRRGIRAARNAGSDLADKAEWHTLTKAEQQEQINKMHAFRNTPEGHNAIMRRNKDRQGKYNEEVDLYDLVLEYLLDEGLCESVENAEIMMAHMSEEWVDAIVESYELDEELINERLTRRRVNRAFNKFNDQNMNPERYRKPGETKNPRGIPNYTLIAAATHKEGSPNRYNSATSDDYRDSGNRPTKRGGRGRKGEPKTGYYGTDRRDSDRGSGNAARRRASGR